MLGSSKNIRVYIADGPTDMRKGFNGLFALARDAIGIDPLCGHLFLFVSRNRKTSKILFWDGTGLCLFQKRLEKGRFAAIWERIQNTGDADMTTNELQLFIEGADVRAKLSKDEFIPT